jgi:hypothetical protein
MKALRSFGTSETTHTGMKCHILEDLYLQGKYTSVITSSISCMIHVLQKGVRLEKHGFVGWKSTAFGKPKNEASGVDLISLFNTEHEDSRCLQNVGTYVPQCMAVSTFLRIST